MMARNPGNPANSLKEITDSVIRQKINGTPTEAIVSQLIARGWPELTARQFVTNVSSNGAVQIDLGERYAVLKGYLIRMVRGFVCLILGLVIVVVGLSMA